MAYARARFITIVPEIEMPGHSQAALAAYPSLGCTAPATANSSTGFQNDVFCPKDETFRFLQDVLSEVSALFPGPYIHIGGDEVTKDSWKQSPEAQAIMRREGLKDENELETYFVQRIERFLRSKGKRTIGWDEPGDINAEFCHQLRCRAKTIGMHRSDVERHPAHNECFRAIE